jgi:hypothetical protein
MLNQINTVPIQQFIQQVKSAELSQQREIKLDIKTAKTLALCLGEVSSKLLEDYSKLLVEVQKSAGNQDISVSMDGGGFQDN